MREMLSQLLGRQGQGSGDPRDSRPVKTITILMEVEYTADKPDATELARSLERTLSVPRRNQRAIVKVISEER